MDQFSAELETTHPDMKRRPASRWRGVAALLALSCVMAACRGTPALAGGKESREDVAVAVLNAVSGQDRAALRSLALSEDEFRNHVWPTLPAARPERNLPFSYVWGDLRQKSEHHLSSTLARHGGRQYELVSVRTAGAATQYGKSVVHRDTALKVRDERGHEQEIRLFGSLIEQGGRWKVFSYVVAD